MAEEEKAATAEGDATEDVSDVDDSPLPALRRRAAASDDEEGDGGGGGGSGSSPPPRVVWSNSDSDELGAAEVDGEDEGSEECEEVRKEFDAGSGGGGEAKEVTPDEVAAAPEDEGKYEEEEEEAQAETGAELKEEDKENKGFEPDAVPRTGAFYMHDDRFQNKENRGRGRQRDFSGGQKLWNSKDDSVWLHDRFNEINTHDVQHDSTRRPRSPFRAWAGGRTHDVNHDRFDEINTHYVQHDSTRRPRSPFRARAGGRTHDVNHDRFDEINTHYVQHDSTRRPRSPFRAWAGGRTHDANHDRFDEINTRYVQHDSTRRPRSPFRAWAGGRTHDVNHGYLEGTKSASYYHDYRADYKYGSINNYNRFPKEAKTSYYSAKNYRSVPRKSHSYYDEQNFYNARTESRICYVNAKGHNNAPNVNRGKPSRPYQPTWKNTFQTSSVQNNRSQNEEGCSDTGVEKNSHRTLSLQNEQEFTSKQEPPFVERRKARPDILSKLFSSSVRMAHSSLKPQSRSSFGVKAFAPSGEHGNTAGSLSMVKGMPNLGSHSTVSTSNSQYSESRDQGSGLNIGVPTKNKLSTQIFHQNIASASKIQSHPQNTLISSTEDAETSPPPGSNNSLAPSVIIVQNDKVEAVSGSLPCGGGHALDVTGAKDLTLGTPAVLPVMKFGEQHPRGPDIPCTAMAFPGLLAHQPSDNSELNKITWLQTLSGATGVLGATYDPSYIGSHYPQPSVFPRYHCVTEVPVLLNSPEIPGHELGQRKNKLLRYSEMNFAS
ncbi:protein MLN51 homolog isoform X2 [Triticum aestivum]|uniref:protein MLN51 homolog isoform X2 n=1 Tax=Triticum aestivum TaxID=4565 RepID=UPI001D02520A|nr:protein MLN51 homolog isoform X2 [Triticum aestivum]